VTVYLDASVLVALFTRDSLSARADAYLRTALPVLVVSDFAGAAFSSALARRVRTMELTPDHARLAFSNFDAWTARSTRPAELVGTPDAINIAIALRVGAEIATFDEKMAASALALGARISPT
jgi:predicted nucleic acid-binding protein